MTSNGLNKFLMKSKTLNLRIVWARAAESPTEKLGVGEDVIVSATHSEMPKLVSESHFGIAICKQDNLESLAAAVPTKIGEFWHPAGL